MRATEVERVPKAFLDAEENLEGHLDAEAEVWEERDVEDLDRVSLVILHDFFHSMH